MFSIIAERFHLYSSDLWALLRVTDGGNGNWKCPTAKYAALVNMVNPAGDGMLSIVAKTSDVRETATQHLSAMSVCLVLMLCRHQWTVTMSLYKTWYTTVSKCKSAETASIQGLDEACCSIQHPLQFVCHRSGWAGKYVAVIHSGCDISGYQCLYVLTVQWPSYSLDLMRNMLHRHRNQVCPSWGQTKRSRQAWEHGPMI